MTASSIVPLAVAFLPLVACGGTAPSKAASTPDNELELPADFRRSMVHLGSWFVPDGDASGFHDVYADADAVDHYRKTQTWPDGAKLVKELRSSEPGSYTTGTGVHRATDNVKQWFVMVKDSDASGTGPQYGHGWGWALYKPDDPSVNVSTNYVPDCLGCHVPAQSTDYVYVQAYPTLASAE